MATARLSCKGTPVLRFLWRPDRATGVLLHSFISTSLGYLLLSRPLVFCTLFYDSYNKLWGPARWLPLLGVRNSETRALALNQDLVGLCAFNYW